MATQVTLDGRDTLASEAGHIGRAQQCEHWQINWPYRNALTRHTLQLKATSRRGTVQRLLKFLHTMGAIGFMGSLACLLVLENLAPPPSALAGYAFSRSVMAAIATWIYLPSFLLTLVPGLLAITASPAFLNARWVWIKAATGILIFAGGLHVLAPIQDEARLSADVIAGQQTAAVLAGTSQGEVGTIWLLLVVATINVILGIWRQRITR